MSQRNHDPTETGMPECSTTVRSGKGIQNIAPTPYAWFFDHDTLC